MNKPKNWWELPYRIKRWFLESLEYDFWYNINSSTQEEILEALCLNNKYLYSNRVQEKYEDLDTETLYKIVSHFLNGLIVEEKEYKILLGKNYDS